MPNPFLLFTSGYATAEQTGIQAFLFDEDSGALTLHGSFSGIPAPSFLSLHPGGRFLYAVSELGMASHSASGEVWSFRIEHEPFSIQFINKQPSNGDWPCHLRFDRTGKWLVTTNYGTGSAAIYPVNADGSLGRMTDFVQHTGTGPNTARQEAAHAHSSIFTPDNRFLIVADLGMDQLVIYRFDSAMGKLTHHASVNTNPGAGPRHLAFHPNNRIFYAANELDCTVTVYDFDTDTCALSPRQTISTLPAGAPQNTVADLHLSADGKRLYASNRGHDSIAVYDVNNDGSLSLVAIPSCGGKTPRNFALAPGGRFVLTANQDSNQVNVLPIVADSHGLGSSITSVEVMGASCVVFA